MSAVQTIEEVSLSQAGRGAVEVRDISRTYGSGADAVLALKNVSLSIPAQSFLSIVGPSGCGKSTLLNILAGFDRPSSGSALVDGAGISGPSAQRGVVFQDTSALFPWLTVAGNAGFGLRAAGLPRVEIEKRVADVLALVGLSAFAQKRPNQLSGGMRQLVALARVLVMKPQLLLMDEPFAALDALTRQTMQSHLIDIWQRTRTTIVLITHSVEEAIYLGDEVIVLSGRPGIVRARLPVDLTRPRDVTSVAFNQIKAEALRHLGIK